MRASSDDNSPSKDTRLTGRSKTRRMLNVPLLVGTLIALVILGPAAYCLHKLQARRVASGFVVQANGELADWVVRMRILRRDKNEKSPLADDARQEADDAQTEFPEWVVEEIQSGEEPALTDAAQEMLAEWVLDLVLTDEKPALAAAARQGVERQGVDWVAAAGHLHRYLRLHPDDVDMQVRLAVIFDQSVKDPRHKWGVVQNHYYPVLGVVSGSKYAEKEPDLRRRLAELLIETRQFALAESEAEKLLKANDKDPRAWRLLAWALYGEFQSGALVGRPKGGMSVGEAFERALALSPKDVQLAATLAGIYRNEDKEELLSKEKRALAATEREQLEQLADKLVDQMVAANPKAPEAFLARYGYRVQYGLPGAKDDLNSALEHGPDNVAVLLAAARDAQREASIAQQALVAKQEGASQEQLAKHLHDAREYYERVVKLAPSAAIAYLGLGNVYLAQGEPDQAIETWQRGLNKCGKENVRLNFALADALITYGRVDKIGRLVESEQKELADLLADKKWGLSASQREGLRRRLTVWFGDKPRALPEGAEEELADLLTDKEWGLSASQAEELSRRLTVWLVAKPPKSLEMLDHVLASRRATLTPAQRIEFHRTNDLLRARWFVRKRDYSEAVPLLRGVASGGGGTASEVAQAYQAWMLLAGTHSAVGEWGQAAKCCEQAASLQPNLPDPRVKAAEAWIRATRFDLATGQYRLALAVADDPEVKFQLANTQFVQEVNLPKEQRDWGLFRTALDELKDPKLGKSLGEAWRVNLLEASYLLARAPKESPGDGAEAERSRAIRAAKGLLDKAERSYPDSKTLSRALVMAYEQLGFQEDADRALATFRKFTPGLADGYLLGCQVLVPRKQYDEARELLREGIRELPPEKRAPLQLVLPKISIVEGDLERAKKEVLLLHQEEPANVSLVWFLADLALQMDRADDLKKWERKLEEAEGANGVYWQYCRARRLLNEASKAMEQARGTDDREVAKKARATIEDRVREAVALSVSVQRQRPTWHRAHELRGRVFEQIAWLETTAQGRRRVYEAAIDAYGKAINSGAERIALYERLVPLFARLGRRGEAERCLAALKVRGELSESLLPYESANAIGAAREQGGLPEALKVARRGVDARPTDPDAQYWYALLLLEDGQQEEAEAAFRKAIELAPKDLQRYLALFEFYVRTRQRERAEETLQGLADNSPLSALDLALVLAQSYERLGDPGKAEAKYREAEKLAEDNISLKVNIKYRLAAIFSRSDLAEVEKLLREILELAPESDAARQRLAELLAQRALATPGERGERVWQEIQQLLQQSSSGGKASRSSQRVQAALWLARGGEDNLARARRFLEKLIEDAIGNVDPDRFYLAMVYGRQSEPYRADAERYEKLRASDNLAKADRELVESHRQYTRLFGKSREQFLAIVARDEPHPFYLESYIDLLFRHKQALPPRLKDEATPWLKKLETIVIQPQPNTALLNRYFALLRRHKLEDEASQSLTKLEEVLPDSLYVLALRARWLHDCGRTSEIEPLVEPLAKKLLDALEKVEEKKSERKAQVCLAVGQVLSGVEQHQAAEGWYRRLAELLPEGYEPLAISLARQGRHSEAIDICLKEAAKSDSSPRPAMVVASVLTSGQATKADFQLAESLLSEAAAAHKDNAQLLSAVANVRIMQNRYEDAAKLYRQALGLIPKDPLALNNLATVLSEEPDTRAEALRLIERAIQIAGPTPALLDTKGTALIHDGKADQAIPFLEQAASGLRPDPRFPFHLAIAYHQAGERAKAKATFTKALDGDLERQILTSMDKRYLSELKQKLGQ